MRQKQDAGTRGSRRTAVASTVLTGSWTRTAGLLVAVSWLSASWMGCAGPPAGANVDRISRTGLEFFTFLQSRGSSIAEIRSSLPDASVDTVVLVAPSVSNDELAHFVRVDGSGYPFEIFLPVGQMPF